MKSVAVALLLAIVAVRGYAQERCDFDLGPSASEPRIIASEPVSSRARVVILFCDSVCSAQVRDLPTGFAFLDDRKDLLVDEFAPFNRSSWERRASFYGVANNWGRSDVPKVIGGVPVDVYRHREAPFQLILRPHTLFLQNDNCFMI